MAYFAECRVDNNYIIRVIVVAQSMVDKFGGDLSTGAEEAVARNIPDDNSLFPEGEYPETYWKQTTKDRSYRKNYAGEGMIYDSEKDMFIPQQPYPSWTLDSNGNWNAPVAPPTKDYAGSNVNEAVDRSWDEDNQQWIGIDYEDSTNYIWNTTTSYWETA